MDEGHVTDGLGRKVDFTHSIIIATSNAGYQIILRALKEEVDFSSIKQEIFDELLSTSLLESKFDDVNIELISSGGGVFEVTLEKDLIFSKKALERFPEDGEVEKLIQENLN